MSKKAPAIVLGMLVLIATALGVYSKLQFELGLTTLAAEDSEEYRHFEEYSRQFPSGQNTWVLAVDFKGKKPGREEFQQVDSLCARVEKLDGVSKVYSLASIRIPQRSILGIRNRRLLPLHTDRAFDKGWNRLGAYPDVTIKFV